MLAAPPRRENGYRDYGEADAARRRLVLSLRRLGLGPEDAGRLARLCLDHDAIDSGLAPVLADQPKALVMAPQLLPAVPGRGPGRTLR